MRSLCSLAVLVCVAMLTPVQQVAAQTQPASAPVAPGQAAPEGLPRLVAMSGTLVNAAGQPHAGRATLTFALYADQQDGAALWTETQTVEADERGRYSVRLGTQTPLPVELFQTTEARWLGVRNGDGVEPPRVRLLSVPYALKAGDAETLGGLPAAAYLRAAAGGTTATETPTGAVTGSANASEADPIVPHGVENSGTPFATGYGFEALLSNSSGLYNSAFGFTAMHSNTTGGWNTAAGAGALYSNTSGGNNSAFGSWALSSNAGGGSTALGSYALVNNTTGTANTAAGLNALFGNTTGSQNTAVGLEALFYNTTGSHNVALGSGAGSNSTTGNDNVYIANYGLFLTPENGAIYLGTEGTHTKTVLAGNVGVGTSSPIQKLDVRGTGSTFASITGTSGGNVGLILNNGGSSSAVLKSNAADGSFTIDAPNGTERLRVSASGNVGVGTPAPLDAMHVRFSDATGSVTGYAVQNLGSSAASYSGMLFYDQNGALGQFQGFNNSTHEYRINNIAPSGSINFMIGSISRFFVGSNGNIGISTTNPTNPLEMGSGAYVSPGGVWTNASSRTFKHDIADLATAQAEDAVAHMHPVTFTYNAEPDQRHVGFIAEEVPDLVASQDRKSLSAMDVVAVLTKVVQTQQATIRDLQATNADMAGRLARLEALVASLTGGRQ